ncbi:transport and Golgi organization protein 11 isoform X2 [Atheta coriaria]|uniref:transport and Golgi organization protein 11 isoform X2 n=1 Tax=Dalotia coriaria TaxID=877792 RepID=UPI0031F40757
MSSNTSPLHYNDLEDAFITDANFKVDISQKMKVPSKISFNSDMNGHSNGHWNDNIHMQVPERILVAGQDQHVGTRAPPREIVFDHSLMNTEPYPGDVRVATPPRTLTLDKYPFPLSAKEQEPEPQMKNAVVVKPSKYCLNDSDLNLSVRESTPPLGGGGEGLTASEEVLHLRRQMAKLNRRVMALELEHLGRLQKEKVIYGFGIAYFLLKAIFWLNRS